MNINTRIHEFLHSNQCEVGDRGPLNNVLKEGQISYIAQQLEQVIYEESYIAKVEEFHKTFNHPITEDLKEITHKRMQLRVNLIKEEFEELKGAFNTLDETLENIEIYEISDKNEIHNLILKSKIEVADALADLMYVLVGTILECGLKDKFDEIFSEVHRSNMSKSCDTLEEADKTKEYYEKLGKLSNIEHDSKTNKYLVYGEDRKTLKSIKYSPAHLLPILLK